MLVRPGGIVVRIKIDPRPGVAPAPVDDQVTQFVKRMLDGILHERFGKPDDIVRWNIGGDMR